MVDTPHDDRRTGAAPPPDRPPIAPLWRNRDYLLLWGGQIVSTFGAQVSQLAFPLLVLALTHSPAQAGIIAGLRGVPFALFSLPAGALIDRWNRKRTMILSDLGRALALGSIPLALLLGRLSLVQLGLVALVEGTLFTLFSLAESAALSRVVPRQQLPAALSQSQLTDALAQLLGPTLAGALFGLGLALPFAVDALSYLVSVVSLGAVRREFQEERAAAPARLRAEIGEGLVYLWNEGVLRFLALLTGGLMVCSVGYPLIMIVLAQRVRASPFAIGLIFAAGGVGSIAGAVLAAPLQRRVSFGWLMVWSAWLWAVTWLFFLVAPDVPTLAVANALAFVIVPIYMVTQYGYRLATIPDRLQGRVNAVFRLVVFGSQPVGLAVAGYLLQRIGPDRTIVLLFVPQLVLAVAATLSPRLRHARLYGQVGGVAAT